MSEVDLSREATRSFLAFKFASYIFENTWLTTPSGKPTEDRIELKFSRERSVDKHPTGSDFIERILPTMEKHF